MQIRAYRINQRLPGYNTGIWHPDPELLDPFPRRARLTKGLRSVFAAIGILLLLIVAGYGWPLLEHAWIVKTGTAAQGVILKAYTQDTSASQSGDSTLYFFHIRYPDRVDGHLKDMNVNRTYYYDHSVGDSLALRYLPDRPHWVILDEGAVTTRWTLLAATGIVLLVLIGLWKHCKETKELLEKGQAIMGLITKLPRVSASGFRCIMYYEYRGSPYEAKFCVRGRPGRTPPVEGQAVTLLVDTDENGAAGPHQSIIAYPYLRGFKLSPG